MFPSQLRLSNFLPFLNWDPLDFQNTPLDFKESKQLEIAENNENNNFHLNFKILDFKIQEGIYVENPS